MLFARRKWGWYLTLVEREHFKVKLLRFKKYRNLGKQYHNDRSELWLILNGEHKGDWVHIPARKIHDFHANVATYILEIQYGEQCEEKDIVRVKNI